VDPAPTAPEPQPVDVGWALTRAEATALCGTVTTASHDRRAESSAATSAMPTTGSTRRWSLSPDAIRIGLEAMLGTETGRGCVEVVRLPGALRSPEMWHIRLTGVQPGAAELIGSAVRRAQGRDESDVR
jgi:hypothetical protein